MNPQKISIITASYNYADYIKETIESVINQTYSNWEMFIVDDGSTDNSIEIIQNYAKQDARIKLLTHENNKNCGLYKTLELGIKKAEGEYIVFLESDDTITPDYIERKLEIFEQYNDVGLIYNDIRLFGENDNSKNKYIKKINTLWKKKEIYKTFSDTLYLWNIIPTFSCVMLKRKLLNNCKLESDIPAWTDWFLWAQIANKTNFLYIDFALTNWRIHKSSYMSRTKLNPEKMSLFFSNLYKALPKIRSWKNMPKIYLKMFCRIIKFKTMQILKIGNIWK